MESAEHLALGFQTAFFELQMPTCTSVSISHGGDKVLQTYERYTPAEMTVLHELHRSSTSLRRDKNTSGAAFMLEAVKGELS